MKTNNSKTKAVKKTVTPSKKLSVADKLARKAERAMRNGDLDEAFDLALKASDEDERAKKR